MGIQVRQAKDRGYFDYGWLKTFHTFSFGSYENPAHPGFRSLRVINEDRMRPGTGFPLHSHQDMEIFSLVLKGGVTHQDNQGNASILYPGQIPLMSAGTGMTYSELNASDKAEAHFLQIWILPSKRKLNPTYQEKVFSPSQWFNKWGLIISPDGQEDSLTIHQDVRVYLASLEENKESNYELAQGRYGWIQMTKGKMEINGIVLEAGDGAAISETTALQLKTYSASECVFFDLN